MNTRCWHPFDVSTADFVDAFSVSSQEILSNRHGIFQ